MVMCKQIKMAEEDISLKGIFIFYNFRNLQSYVDLNFASIFGFQQGLL